MISKYTGSLLVAQATGRGTGHMQPTGKCGGCQWVWGCAKRPGMCAHILVPMPSSGAPRLRLRSQGSSDQPCSLQSRDIR